MNSDDFDLFARVARAGSILRAAMDLGTNQSTVSRRIALIEADLGVRLFKRSGRGVRLTEHGDALLGYANVIEQTIKEAVSTTRNGGKLGPARLCIAAQPTIARMMFGTLGHRLKARFPSTRVRFVEGLASHILGWLGDGEVDLSIMYVPEQRSTTEFDVMLSEAVCLVTPHDYPMPDGHVAVSALGGIPLILPSAPHGLRLLVESLGAQNGFTPNIVLEW